MSLGRGETLVQQYSVITQECLTYASQIRISVIPGVLVVSEHSEASALRK